MLRARVLLVLVLVASWTGDATRYPTEATVSVADIIVSDDPVLQINHHMYRGQIKVPKESGGEKNMCTLCEEFVTEVLDVLEDNSTQTEIIDILHEICSGLLPIKNQCTTLVDYYVPLAFSEISSAQPKAICQYIRFCDKGEVIYARKSKDKCEVCHRAIAKVLSKLKDPDMELEIIEVLFKACNAAQGRARKRCKTLVFKYGPFILESAPRILEKMNVCSVLHACNSYSST